MVAGQFETGVLNVMEALDFFRQTFAATGDRLAALRAVRMKFGMSLRQAKEVMLPAEGRAATIDEHETRGAVGLQQALAGQKCGGPDDPA